MPNRLNYGGTVLKVPNYVIKTIYLEQYFQRINEDYNIQMKDVRDAVMQMRVYGDIQPLVELLKGILEDLSKEKVKQEGIKQLEGYGESKLVQEELGDGDLKKALILVVGKNIFIL